ncbi:type I restriction enzyme, S subunit [Malonomonas rubra DSM 5091]|uniref:Type I restriction enzyme, S subunit n=1 Tax=Malonomonas rubra DSM 5091 TaxID=1122189 RepID=A0A1M6H2Y4_MALRU|nr:restriction endonuclease subunit S [Malonomonas rubra]SHJ16502.1 type I restriction enzyme, S subunit [Malonomonas rubra DSM 5091]
MTSQFLNPGWKMVKFGEVVKNANLVERDPGANGVERIVGLEHIDPENLHIRRWNSAEDSTSFTRKFVPGQTLFGKRRAYQRKVAYAEFEGICSGDILTFESKDKAVFLPELLPFICQSDAFFDHALDTSAGSLSPRTNWKALKGYEFPLPPLGEQMRIAELLWATDDAIEKQKIAHKKTTQLLESIRDHEICSKAYKWKKLGSVLKSIVAGKSVVGVNTPAGANEFGVLKVSAVGSNGFEANENKRLIDSSAFLPQYRVNEGALLITRCNTTDLVGRACLTHKGYSNLMLCDKTLQLVLDDSKADKRYIFEALRARNLRTQIMGRATGTGGAMKNISQQDIRSLLVPFPPLEVQKMIAAKVVEVNKRIVELDNQIYTLRSLAKRLSIELIYESRIDHA